MRKLLSMTVAGCALVAVSALGAPLLERFRIIAPGSEGCGASNCGNTGQVSDKTDQAVSVGPPARRAPLFDTNDGSEPFSSPTPGSSLQVGSATTLSNPGAPLMGESEADDFSLPISIDVEDAADDDLLLANWSPGRASGWGQGLFGGRAKSAYPANGGGGSAAGGRSAGGGSSKGSRANDQLDSFVDKVQGEPVESLLALAVPEPGAWLMMIMGTGLTGVILRRRRGASAQA